MPALPRRRAVTRQRRSKPLGKRCCASMASRRKAASAIRSASPIRPIGASARCPCGPGMRPSSRPACASTSSRAYGSMISVSPSRNLLPSPTRAASASAMWRASSSSSIEPTMHDNPFSDGEIDARLARVRQELAQRKLDAAIFASPENVFYLTGLDHWGYFAPHLLIVSLDGRNVLVTRTMERVSVEKQVRSADFHGHSHNETAADMATRVLKDLKLANRRIGLEYWTSGLSFGLASSLQHQVAANWSDITGLADGLRLVKSAEERALMGHAARISDKAAEAAISAIADGARESDVAASCMAAMVKAGGHPPGFGPFIRPGSRLGEEHATWGDGRYRKGDPVFL